MLSTSLESENENTKFTSDKPRRKRNVHFEDGDRLISAVFDPIEPWANGTQLNESHVEILEEVLKRVQFEHLNLENTNLTDESIIALCDMIEFYQSCTELCLARNAKIQARGWKKVAHLIRKLPCLKWLDLRGVKLSVTDVHLLAYAIRSQAMLCRAEANRHCKSKQAYKRLLLAVKHLTVNSDHIESRSQSTINCPAHGQPECNQCLSQSPYQGLRGLHLSDTLMRGAPLVRLMNSVRLSAICDLRLSDNQLGLSEAEALIPLLRYGASLKYLDLSRNKLGDRGCELIANALGSTAFPVSAVDSILTNSSSSYSSTTTTTTPSIPNRSGLRQLDLSANQLTPRATLALTTAFLKPTSCFHSLRVLRLAHNPAITCTGVVNMRSGIIQCRQLRRLDLAFCGIQCVGAVALAEVLVDRPRRLKHIHLRGNQIGAAGLLAFARCLQCADRLVCIDGLDPNGDRWMEDKLTTPASPDPVAVSPKTMSGTPEISLQSPEPLDPLLHESLEMFRHHLRDNANRYATSQPPATRQWRYVSPTLFPQSPTQSPSRRIDYGESGDEAALNADPRHLWGDRSDSGEDSDADAQVQDSVVMEDVEDTDLLASVRDVMMEQEMLAAASTNGELETTDLMERQADVFKANGDQCVNSGEGQVSQGHLESEETLQSLDTIDANGTNLDPVNAVPPLVSPWSPPSAQSSSPEPPVLALNSDLANPIAI